jgi:hypothetical protein
VVLRGATIERGDRRRCRRVRARCRGREAAEEDTAAAEEMGTVHPHGSVKGSKHYSAMMCVWVSLEIHTQTKGKAKQRDVQRKQNRRSTRG